ncbi:MAG: hypothetical protein C4558_06460 [Dehalococcoidia bacterium]|nr:MAG: hypothetical protein C4558_06460 [Dehalococcoidia bacterium]
MRQFWHRLPLDRALKQDVIYVSITGFGTTGPWGERPLSLGWALLVDGEVAGGAFEHYRQSGQMQP